MVLTNQSDNTNSSFRNISHYSADIFRLKNTVDIVKELRPGRMYPFFMKAESWRMRWRLKLIARFPFGSAEGHSAYLTYRADVCGSDVGAVNVLINLQAQI